MHGTHVADMSQPNPSKHNNTTHYPHLHNSGTTQLLLFWLTERKSSSVMECRPGPSPSTARTQKSQVREQHRCTLIFHIHTLIPKSTAPAARTRLQTTFSSYWNCKNHGTKKSPKVRKHRLAMLGQVRVRTRGGGVNCWPQDRIPIPAGPPSAFHPQGV